MLRVALAPLLFGGAVAYGEIVGWEGEARTVLYLAAAATVFVQVGEPMLAGFQATERMEYMAYSEVVSKSAQGLVGIIVVLLGFGTIGVTAAWMAMAGVVVALNGYWLRKLLRIELRTNVRRMIRVARESIAYWAYGVFFMLYLWLDFVLLSLLTRDEVVGWYAVPMKLFQTMMFLPVIISVAWLPRFVRGFEAGGDELRREARTPIALVVLLSLPIAAVTIVAANPVLGLLYGAEYENSAPVMMILGICLPPMYLNIMLSQVLVAMKRQTAWTWAMAAATAVNPLFNFALIPATESRYGNGAIGAAASLFLTELVVVTAGVVLVGRYVLDGATLGRLGLAAAAAAAACGAGFAADAFGAAASLAAAAATFVALAIVLRLFTAEEIQLMRSGLDRARRRLPLLSRRAAAAPAGPDEHRPV
jgi:O-antigen/teichoic acid export membrane protein